MITMQEAIKMPQSLEINDKDFKLCFASNCCNYVGSRPSDHYFCSVYLSVCLFVCLFVCAVFLSRLWSDFDQTRTHVICLGL